MENLVAWPPKLQPVPVKPFFFDIAYNYFGLEAKEGGGEEGGCED